MIDQEKQNRLQEQKIQLATQERFKSAEIQDALRLYDTQLKQIYDHYCQYNEFKLNKDGSILEYKGFMNFVN